MGTEALVAGLPPEVRDRIESYREALRRTDGLYQADGQAAYELLGRYIGCEAEVHRLVEQIVNLRETLSDLCGELAAVQYDLRKAKAQVGGGEYHWDLDDDDDV